MEPEPIGASRLTMHQLEEIGMPFLVSPDDLRSLGVDPDMYFNSFGTGVGWMFDRKKDADLIGRLRSMREPHGTRQ